MLGFPRPELFYETQKRCRKMYLHLVDIVGQEVYNN